MTQRFDDPERDEESKLLQEFMRRGLNPGPAAALSTNRQEFIYNLKQRLTTESTPGLQESRQQARANVAAAPTRPLLRPEMVEKLPGPLQPVGHAVREFTSPTMLAATGLTAGVGPAVAAGLRGGAGLLGAVRGGAASLLAPVARGPFAARLAAEFGVGTAAELGSQTAERVIPQSAPTPLRVAGQLGAGLLGAGGAVGAMRAAPGAVRGAGRGFTRAAEEVGRTNVGNALLPAAPQPQAAGKRGPKPGTAANPLRGPDVISDADRARAQSTIDAISAAFPNDRTVNLGRISEALGRPIDEIAVDVSIASRGGMSTGERSFTHLGSSRPGQEARMGLNPRFVAYGNRQPLVMTGVEFGERAIPSTSIAPAAPQPQAAGRAAPGGTSRTFGEMGIRNKTTREFMQGDEQRIFDQVPIEKLSDEDLRVAYITSESYATSDFPGIAADGNRLANLAVKELSRRGLRPGLTPQAPFERIGPAAAPPVSEAPLAPQPPAVRSSPASPPADPFPPAGGVPPSDSLPGVRSRTVVEEGAPLTPERIALEEEVRVARAQMGGRRLPPSDGGGTPPPGDVPPPGSGAGGAVPPAGDQDPLKALTDYIGAAKPANEETAELAHKVRQQRTAAAAAALKKATTGKEMLRTRGLLGGNLPVAEFEPPTNLLTDQQWDQMHMTINHTPRLDRATKMRRGKVGGRRGRIIGGPHDRVGASEALEKIRHGAVPTNSEIDILEKVFGIKFAEALRQKKMTRGDKILDAVLNVWNIPRSVLSAVDLSASLRQGGWFSTSHPKEFAGAFKAQLQAIKSSKAAEAIDEALQMGADADRRVRAGVYHSPLDASVSRSEEVFASKWAEKIPGVTWSQRGYVTFLNKLRADTFDTIVHSWERDGRKFTDTDLSELAKYINYASGRGPLGLKGDSKAGKILSSLFFSPRFTTSRPAIAVSMLSKSRAVRQQAWRDFILYASPRMGLLTMAAASGIATVDLDPRSSDFGKLRIGNARIDPWSGWQPLVRYTAQILAGQTKDTRTGQIDGTGDQRFMIGSLAAAKFLRSKAAPLPGTFMNVRFGRNLAGERASLGPQSLSYLGEPLSLMVPLLAQDAMDMADDMGLVGAGIGAIASGVGLGVQSYPSVPVEWRKDMDKYFDLPSDSDIAKKKRVPSRDAFRKANPKTEAKLFVAGAISSFSTGVAKREAVRLMKEQGIKVRDIRSLEPKDDEKAVRTNLRHYFQDALGEPRTDAKGKEIRSRLRR